MPVERTAPINAIGQMHGVKRARDGANNRSMAQNAALGLGNFSEMLKDETAPQRARNTPGPELIKAAGMNPNTAKPYIPGITDTPLEMMALQKMGAALPGNTPAFGMGGLGMPDIGARGSSNLQNMDTFQKAMQTNSQPLRMLNSMNSARPAGTDAAVLALRSAGHKLKDAVSVVAESIGKLSSLFESGREGIAAVGYDKVGGTSYGKYQIASNTGTMDEFIGFLEKKAPALAKELKEAGPANTGGKDGQMPEVWRGIASREPKKFEELQHEFIHDKLYTPTARQLRGMGLDDGKISPVMREVIFSTAVQHGPAGAARIIGRALEGADLSQLAAPEGKQSPENIQTEQQVIKRIYGMRQDQFGSSNDYVRKAVAGRLQSEMNVALNMSKGAETVS